MQNSEQRSGTERRVFTALNANPPYLTKQGPVLYDRRRGIDRRLLSKSGAAKESATNGI
ncbi:MAG: hypothetical protein V4568_19330 [Pseudomonadota bacterium]